MPDFPRAQEGWVPVVIIQGDAPVSDGNPLETTTSVTITNETETFEGGGHRADTGYTPVKLILGDEVVSVSNPFPIRFV